MPLLTRRPPYPPVRSAVMSESPWSLGFKSSLHCAQTGAQNARFVARIYSVDSDALMAYAQDFSEIGRFMDMPAQSYSSGMRARLAFRIIAFGWCFICELTAVGYPSGEACSSISRVAR